MYKLNFINQSQLARLRALMNKNLLEWMDAWVLNKNCTLEINPISYKEFSSRSMFFLTDHGSELPIFFDDKNFNWGKFIFGDLGEPPLNMPKYKNLMDDIKDDFINRIFGGRKILSKESRAFPKVIDAYFLVLIGSDDVGYMEFVSSHPYFSLIMGEVVVEKRHLKLNGNKFEVISGLKVAVDIKIQMKGVSFFDLIHLNSGAVLKSDVAVENKVMFFIDNNQVAYASMGKRKDKRAYLIKGKKDD